MSKKSFFLTSFVLVISQVCNAVEVARWDFEETSGTTATDRSGLYVATLGGSDTLDVDGRFGSGVDFAGDGGAIIDIAGSKAFQFTGDFSIALWIKSDVEFGAHTRFIDISAADGGLQDSYRLFTHSGDDTDNFKFMSRQDGSNTQNIHTRDMPMGTWIMLVLRHDLDGDVTMNVLLDGDSVDAAFVAANSESWPTAGPIVYAPGELKLGRMNGTGRKYDGQMDALAFYDEVLTDEQIATMFYNAVSSEYPLASRPKPEDGAMLSDTWVSLSWTPGDLAVSHDVYFSENFVDVNDATTTSPTFVGNQTSTMLVVGFPGFLYPDGLVPGTTYYWRIDEVNDADPNSPWIGPVWSFSIPPHTAYNPNPADGAEFVDTSKTLSWTPGFGAKLHTVYLGDNYDNVNNASGGSPQGSASYQPASLEAEKIYYWRIDESDPPNIYKGDVWGFTTPGAAGSLSPANGSVDVQINSTLNWTPAATAISHDLYLGTDKDTVRNATTASPDFKGNKSAGSESYDPGKLDWDSDYYWRVDAVYKTGMFKGLVWNFATADFLLVDDFESYNDIDPPDPNSNRIFESWFDGFGTTDNGALVGNDLPPYAEQTVVHSGAQSMPYRYDNTNKTSEATLTLVYPRDWTEEGVTKLSLWFRGAGANAADKIYIALNGNAVVYHDSTAATQTSGWNQWVIDLQAFADQGVNLTNVNTITIGIGTKGGPAAGGTGTMYFDDIRLIR